MREALREVGFIAWRSTRRTVRQPILIVPSIVFPLVLLAVNSGGLGDATKLPGFPADSYLDFALSVTFMQGALFAAVTAGTELATDIESGFLDRLQLTPLRPYAILLGHLAGAATLSMIGITTYVTVGLIAGASIKAGVGGVVVLFALALMISMAFAGIGMIMAVRTGRAESVQGLFPLLFVTLFLSSISLPRPLIEIDWFRTITTYNPVSYLVEGLRSLVIAGWDGSALFRGFGFAIGIGLISWLFAARGLRTRMERT